MRLLLLLVGVAAGLFVLHLILLWMERQGWIYYAKSGGGGDRAGNAFLELHSIFTEDKKYLLEMKRTQPVKRDFSGEKPHDTSGDDDDARESGQGNHP